MLIEKNKPYRLLKQFDIYNCNTGRVTVNPGTTFTHTSNNRIYLIIR